MNLKRITLTATIFTLVLASSSCDPDEVKGVRCSDGKYWGFDMDDHNKLKWIQTKGHADITGACQSNCEPLQDIIKQKRDMIYASMVEVRSQEGSNPYMGEKAKELEVLLNKVGTAYQEALGACRAKTMTAYECGRKYKRGKCWDRTAPENKRIALERCSCELPMIGDVPEMPANYGMGDPEGAFRGMLPQINGLKTGRKQASTQGLGQNMDFAQTAMTTNAATAAEESGQPPAAGPVDSGVRAPASAGGSEAPSAGSATAAVPTQGRAALGAVPIQMGDGPKLGDGPTLSAVSLGDSNGLGAPSSAKYNQGTGGGNDGGDSVGGGRELSASSIAASAFGAKGPGLGKDVFAPGGAKDFGKSALGNLKVEDPEDYFTRADQNESIFKRASKRYTSTTIGWMKDDIANGRATASELIMPMAEEQALTEKIRQRK